MKKRKRILLTPLDWGLGHAARCVPVIRELTRMENEVLIAADQHPVDFLRREFPDLKCILLPGYKVRYPKHSQMILKMLMQAPAMIRHIYKENTAVNQIIDDEAIDLIISDNRFGMWSNKIPCIFITHQLHMKAPWGQWLANKANSFFYNKYDQIWVPDRPGQQSLAGELIDTRYAVKEKVKFIGPLSRFEVPSSWPEEKYDFMAIISGPEPQRSIFEEIIFSQLKNSGKKGVILQGLPGEIKHFQLDHNIAVYSHLDGKTLFDYLLRSKIVITRSGYTTIMELATLGKRAILVPTPGQTEQEYLAAYHAGKGHIFTCRQEAGNLQQLLDKPVPHFPQADNPHLLEKVLKGL